ncbi:AAA family ATPase [Ignicoccus hospitalis]|uniref:SMC domain protein n=1 Tax=Ignicoccus hospitalis (strain KIN4/I / DSM 18386 / JCM 14125) TaxID=453591 RepID=A8ACA9_IGNH4|nr:AAA family ATPase [Ignicoccus hospitalis]ABU82561.1 SMC domain protein [Ignicoccus hospitalis KIN4/I]HIH90726.1 AAA family ATPase [Desulfurococcaceae archaeon]
MKAQLLKLELRNFLSYENLEVRIPEGVVVVVGPNGAGKSSFVDAIAYALTSAAVSRKVTNKELINYGAKSAEVVLTFSASNKVYEVKRAIGVGNSVQAVLKEGGKLYASGSQAVNKAIASLLGFGDVKALRETVFVPQGKLTELVELSPSELKNKVLELLGVRDKEAVEASLREIINYYKGTASNLVNVQRTYEKYKKELNSEMNRIKELQEKLPLLKEELRMVEDKLNDLRSELNELKEKKAKYQKVKAQLMKVQEELRTLIGELEALSDLDEAELNLLRSKLVKVKDLSLIKERLENELKAIKSKKELLAKREAVKSELRKLKDLERRRDELSKKLDEMLERRQLLVMKLGTLEKEVEEIEKEIKRIEKNYVVLERELDGLTISDLEQRVTELEKMYENVKKELEEVTNERRLVEVMLDERRRAIEMLRGRDSCPVCGSPLPPERRESLIRRYAEEVAKFEEKLTELKAREKRLETEARLLESRLEKLKRALDKARARLESLGFEDLDALGLYLADLKKRFNELKEQLSRTRASVEHYDKLVKEVKEELSAVTAQLEELKRKEGMLRQIEHQLEELRGVDASKEEEVEKRLSEIKKELEVLGSPEELERRIAELERLASKKKELSAAAELKRREEAELKRELASLGFDEASLERLAREVEALERKRDALLRNISETEAKIMETRRNVAKLREELNRYQNEIEKLRAYEQYAIFLEEFRKTFSTVIIDKLTESFRKAWEEEANRILDMFDLNVKKVEIKEIIEKRKKGWTIRAVLDGGARVTVDSLSGGERVGVALALRLSLAKLLSRGRISFLIMDEPTAYLDSERRQALKKIISYAVGPSLTQMIVVTHDREMMDIADSACHVRRTPKGSTITCE